MIYIMIVKSEEMIVNYNEKCSFDDDISVVTANIKYNNFIQQKLVDDTFWFLFFLHFLSVKMFPGTFPFVNDD